MKVTLPQDPTLNMNASGSKNGVSSSSMGGSFLNHLQNYAHDTINTLRHSESLIDQQAGGYASPVEVSLAVAEAQKALEVMTTLRDKFTQGVEKIMNTGA